MTDTGALEALRIYRRAEGKLAALPRPNLPDHPTVEDIARHNAISARFMLAELTLSEIREALLRRKVDPGPPPRPSLISNFHPEELT